MCYKHLIRFFRSNKIITVLFLITLVIWLWQRSTGASWDFAVYSLNAEYIFGGGNYLQPMVPPLAYLLMFPIFLGKAVGEFFFVIITSIIFLYSVIKLADTYSLNRTALYIFSLTPFSIAYAFSNGTELLSLSLLYLLVSFIYTKKPGIFAGLLLLARYSNITLLPILLFQKNIKRILLSLAFLIVILSIFFVFSWGIFGDPFTSITDFYALNVKYRDYIHQPLNPLDVLIGFNFTLPFLILGLYVAVKKRLNRIDIMMIVIIIITIVAYWRVPIKDPRYLYHLILPAAYFASYSLKKIKFKHTILVFLAITLVTLAFMVPAMRLADPTIYKEIAAKVNCATKSNIWVSLSYYGLPSVPSPRGSQLQKSIEDGYRIVIANGFEGDITDPEILKSIPIIENNTYYKIIGDKSKCKPIGKADYRYLRGLNEYLNSTYNYTVPTDIFTVVFGKQA